MSRMGHESDAPLARLIERLESAGGDAGEAYEALRRLLIRYFEVRGRHDADVLVDQVLDRLAHRLDDGTAVEDLGAYARGIARLVFLEALRRQPDARIHVEPVAPDPATDDETMDQCLSSCLARLDSGARRQVLAYYAADGRARIDGRKTLADQIGISATALRLRMLRLRMQLEACINRCRDASPGNGQPSRSTSS